MEQDRNIVYIFKGPHNTTTAINYSGHSDVNSFLWHFDIWGSNGHMFICADGQHPKFFFECSDEFFDLATTETFQRAFHHMGVVVTTNYEDVRSID